MPLMVCVRADWYRRRHKPKPLLMKQLSGKMRLLSDTMCRLFFFFVPGLPTRSMMRKHRRDCDNFETAASLTLSSLIWSEHTKTLKRFQGILQVLQTEFQLLKKVGISLHIVPISPGQQLAVLKFSHLNVSVEDTVPWQASHCGSSIKRFSLNSSSVLIL